MPIFKTIDPNADVTFTIWKFDVEGWLDQYDEANMMLQIYQSPGVPREVGALTRRGPKHLHT